MKDKFYKYRFPSLSLLILIFYFLIKAIYKYDPFNPNVWGNVADWTMVVVTAITLLFIYKTLVSQKDVQKTNNRLLEIENNRHKHEIRPVFEFTCKDISVINEESIHLIFKIKLKNISKFEARNFKVSVLYNPIPFKSTLPNIRQTSVLPGNPFEFTTDSHPIMRSFDPLSYYATIEFAVTYSDLYGNFYRQILKYWARNGYSEGWEFLPPTSGYFEDEKWHNNIGQGSF